MTKDSIDKFIDALYKDMWRWGSGGCDNEEGSEFLRRAFARLRALLPGEQQNRGDKDA